ncbi:MAG: hypothetical protein RH917_17600 [Lacipirellulaceae bacterium]
MLRYLIARYEDEQCWNRRRVTFSSAQLSSPQAIALSRPLTSDFDLSPPRRPHDLLPSLRRIREANVDSYRDFGLAAN